MCFRTFIANEQTMSSESLIDIEGRILPQIWVVSYVWWSKVLEIKQFGSGSIESIESGMLVEI
jgi:hypothetical protein